MKKIYLTLGIAAMFFGANAQNLKLTSVGKEQPAKLTLTAKGANPTVQSTSTDTIYPASLMTGGCAVSTGSLGGLVYYVCDRVAPYDSGYYFGTNIFPTYTTTTQEVAQKFTVTATGTVTVTDVLMYAGVGSGTLSTISANIYTVSTTKRPAASALGSSLPVTMATVATDVNNGDFTAFHFATPLTISSGVPYFASVTVPSFGGVDQDTLAILTSKLGCPATGDSLCAIKLQTYGWQLVKSFFGKRLDAMIFPVVNINNTTGMSKVTSGSLSLYGAFPNPAANNVNLTFSLDNASKVEIEVYDMTGRVVKSIKNNEMFATGKHSVSIDITNLEAGSYMYSINAEGNRLASKFVVTK